MPKLNLVKARVISTLSDLESFKRESTLKVLKFAEEHRCNMERIASTLETKYADIAAALGEGFAVESEIHVVPETPAAPATSPSPLPKLQNIDLAHSVLEAMPLIGTEKAAILAERILTGSVSREDLTSIKYALKSIVAVNPKLYQKDLPSDEDILGPLAGGQAPSRDLGSFIDEVAEDKELNSIISKFNAEVSNLAIPDNKGISKYWCPFLDAADIAAARHAEYSNSPVQYLEATEEQQKLYTQLADKARASTEAEDEKSRGVLPTFKLAAFQDSTGAVRLIPNSIVQAPETRTAFIEAWESHLETVFQSVSKAREKIHLEYAQAIAAEKAAEAAGNKLELDELRKVHVHVKEAIQRLPPFDGKYLEFSKRFLTGKFGNVDIDAEWASSVINVIADEELFRSKYVLTETERDYLYHKVYKNTDEAYRASINAGEVPSSAKFFSDLRKQVAPEPSAYLDPKDAPEDTKPEVATAKELDKEIYRQVVAMLKAAHPDNINLKTGEPYSADNVYFIVTEVAKRVKEKVASEGKTADSVLVTKIFQERFPADAVSHKVYRKALDLLTERLTESGKASDRTVEFKAYNAVETIAEETGRVSEITGEEILTKLHQLYPELLGDSAEFDTVVPMVRSLLSRYIPSNVDPRTGAAFTTEDVRSLVYDILQGLLQRGLFEDMSQANVEAVFKQVARGLIPSEISETSDDSDSDARISYIFNVLKSREDSPLGLLNPTTEQPYTDAELSSRADRILDIYTKHHAKQALSVDLVHTIVSQDSYLRSGKIEAPELIERYGLDVDTILLGLIENQDMAKADKISKITDYLYDRVNTTGEEYATLTAYYTELVNSSADTSKEVLTDEDESPVAQEDIRHQDMSNELPSDVIGDDEDEPEPDADYGDDSDGPGLGHRGGSWLLPFDAADCPGCLPLESALKPKVPVADLAKKHDLPESYIQEDLDIGTDIEKEHTSDKDTAEQIASHHEDEIPGYYGEWLVPMEQKAKGEKE